MAPQTFPTGSRAVKVLPLSGPAVVLDLLPQPLELAGFVAAAVILALTPGPDMLFYLSKTIAHGRLAGFATLAGTMSGLLVHTMLVALGLAALVAASATAFTVVKIVGALYLLYLAYESIRHGTRFHIRAHAGEEHWWSLYLKGLFVDLLNPRAIVFFLTFLPQFVSPTDANPTTRLIVLGLVFILVVLPICAVQVLLAGALSGFLNRSPRASRVLDYVFAAVMAAFALRLVLPDGE